VAKQPDEVKELPVDEDGPRDTKTPVKGAELRQIDYMEVFNGLPEKARAKVGKQVLKNHPDQRAARRDKVRFWLAVLLAFAVLIDAGVALYLAAIDKSITWDQLKDWLTLGLVPFTPAMAVAFAFWYPTKESE
jgi:hypothetical protein